MPLDPSGRVPWAWRRELCYSTLLHVVEHHNAIAVVGQKDHILHLLFCGCNPFVLLLN